MEKIHQKFKALLRHFFLIDDSPHKVAGGVAVGIFMGIVPGEGILSTLFVAYILRLNRLAALTAIVAVNMWTTILTLPLAAIVGGFLFRVSPQSLTNSFHTTYTLGWNYFFSKIILFELVLPLMVGFIVVALIISLSFYLIIYFSLKHKKIKFQ